ncbi:MAG: sigma-54-dependent Fis family transcriptional regulator [Calditrichaceae bacterium]|nr:sigma-54 dependent transcriptional regulator [Calditrichia bacterium]NUQ40926.1 sigma-54-dependent Fis family transcriptional regulator [Calditrichaceae bacterium]
MQNPTILIAERDIILRQNLKRQLLSMGHELIEVFDWVSVLQIIRTCSLDIIILGSLDDNDWNALDVAREIRRHNQEISIILLVEEDSEDIAVTALRTGVNDYFRKPFGIDDLLTSINGLLTDCRCVTPSVNPETISCNLTGSEGLIGDNMVMRTLKTYISRVAITDSTVLITGETGTGKELVAELIHKNSPRKHKPYICINCAALPDSLMESELFGFERGAFTGATAMQRGKFELANDGTIFLDEIGDMNLYAQAKILRILESRQILRLGGRYPIDLNVRIIAATNQNLEQLVETKNFRNDLYYRLNVARITIPPLRERREDIPFLLDHYIGYFNNRFGRSVKGFTEETRAYLLRYDWPGNVRELKNLCEAIFINLPSRQIKFADLPELYQKKLKEIENLPLDDREQLVSALFSTNWNVSKAARKLRWSRMTIYRKIEKYHITKPDSPHINSKKKSHMNTL